MTGVQRGIFFVGRLAFSAIFIMGAISKFVDFSGSEQYLVNNLLNFLSYTYDKAWAQSIFDKILPLTSTLLVAGAIVELVGGLMILFNIFTRLGAFMLFVYLVIVTLVFHCFWYLEGAERAMQMIEFMKNLSIMGGALILVTFGRGKSTS